MNIKQIGKLLKKTVKKKITYSLSLLIVFLMTGEITASLDLDNILSEKNKLDGYNLEIESLEEKGSLKSDEESFQLFLINQKNNSGKGKNRTEIEFSETIDALNKKYNITGNLGENIWKDKLKYGGVAVETSSYRDTIILQPKIEILNPLIPKINPEIPSEITIPELTLNELPTLTVSLSTSVLRVTVDKIRTLTKPTGIEISIAKPSSIGRMAISSLSIDERSVLETSADIAAPSLVIPTGYIPTAIVVPDKPIAPEELNVTIFTPIKLDFAGTGFGQPSAVSMPCSNIIAQNYDSYSTTDTIYIETGIKDRKATWSGGNMEVVSGGTTSALVPGNSTSELNAFISDVENHDVTLKGNYVMTRGTLGNTTIMFVSLNPYKVGKGGTIEDRTYTFAGTLTLNGHDSPSEAKCLVGFEHQLLRGGGGGNEFETDSTSILENTGTIILDTGYNMVGIMIDTEYDENAIAGSAFTTQPQTKNSGEIIINGKQSIGIDYGYYKKARPNSMVFLGNIEINGENNYGFRMKDYFSKNNYYYDATNITGSNGRITVAGKKNIGIAIAQGTSNGDPISRIKELNILVNGEENVGFFRNITEASNNADMVLNDATINSLNFGANAKKSTLVRSDQNGIEISKDIKVDSKGEGNSFAQAAVEGKVTNKANLSTLNSEQKNFIGMIAQGKNASIENIGKIEITGDGNIGLATIGAADKGFGSGKNSGTVRVTGDGKNKAGIYNTGTFTLESNSVIEVEGENSSGIFNKKDMALEGNIKINVSKGATAVYSNGGNITIAPSANLNMTVDDRLSSAKGLAVYGEQGAKISLENSNIKVLEGASGIASFSSGTEINMKETTLEYSGSGYALYSDGEGKIDISNGRIVLKGSSTAFEVDLESQTNPINIDGTTITVMSNSVIGVNLKNNKNTLKIGDLKKDIANSLGNGITFKDGEEDGKTYNEYKIAALDGGILNINTNMDKADTDANSAGFYYYRRFLGQNLNISVLEGVKVKASIDSKYANEYFNGQVTGFEMNSSKNASDVNSNKLVLESNSSLIADRTDGGAGAVGIYVNYGTIKLEDNSTIEVEKEKNEVNENGIGIYAVNGTKIVNKGKIDVAGNKAIGIFGMSYREDETGKIIKNEFGKDGEGTIEIRNTKDVNLDGEGSIGIYVKNNNDSVTNQDAVIENTGKIKVGNSTKDITAVGIYGEKASISNIGTIVAGDKSVGIYAAKGSTIENLGTIELGNDGIGVLADSKTIFNKNAALKLTVKNLAGGTADTNGKTGIYLKGNSSQIGESNEIWSEIDISNIINGTAIYSKDMGVISHGKITVGEKGIGILLSSVDDKAINKGNIEIKGAKGIGMYSLEGTIENDGEIVVNESSQAGMFAKGLGSNIINTGNIILKGNKSTGIYIKDGAKAEISNKITFGIGSESSVGIFVDNSEVEVKESITFKENNTSENILIYIQNGANASIDSGKVLTVDGIKTEDGGKKIVGIYMENKGKENLYIGNGKIEVKNGAIGIYSKNKNSIEGEIKASGEKSTGIFLEGDVKLKGTIESEDKAVGIYAVGGGIDVSEAGVKLNLTGGTGAYLEAGASINSGNQKIIIAGDGARENKNIGIYYSKGSNSSEVENKGEIEINGAETIGIYAGEGIKLTNTKDITATANGDIGVFVGEGSEYTSKGKITIEGTEGIAIYSEEGEVINKGEIHLTAVEADKNKRQGIGMASQALKGVSTTVKNAADGVVTAGTNLGMYIAGEGNATGENQGTITVSSGTGVYVKDNKSYFDGTDGTIEVTDKGLGIYLEDTSAGAVKQLGNIKLASGAVGIYGNNAKIDFEVNTSNNKGEIGVVAVNKTEISNNIIAGQGSTGIEILDNTVKLTDGIEITVGKNEGNTSIAAFIAKDIEAYTIGEITLNVNDGIGIYLEEGEKKGTNLTLKGTINVDTGIGAYIKDMTSLITQGAVFNIKDEGTGIYLDGGTAEISNVTFNFKDSKALGIYNNGGKLTLGTKINVAGKGSIAATRNGDLISTGEISGSGEGSIALGGTYDNEALNNNEIKNNGKIILENGSLGIVAAKGDSFSKWIVTVNNEGNILVNSNNDTSSVGIYSNTADIKNTGKIEIKENSIGIYAKNEGKEISLDNSGNIQFSGENGIGIYIDGNLSEDGIKNNNISFTGEASSNRGIILENITKGTLNIGSISLGKESIGIIAKNVKGTLNQGTINIEEGKSSIGVVVDGASEVTLKNGMSINVGKNGIGMYINGEKSKAIIEDVSKITAKENGIILYSKNGEVVFSENMTVDNSIGIVAEGGKLTMNGSANIIAKNGGVGIYIKGNLPTLKEAKIILEGGKSDKYSTGIYYDGITTSKLSIPNIEQKGNFTIGTLFNNSIATVGGVNLEETWEKQVGILAKENSKLTVEENINVAGDKNIGIYGNSSSIELKKDIKVENSSESTDKSKSSIAVYLKNEGYKGNGAINIGDNSIGIYSEEISSLIHTGNNMNIGDNALGIYGTGKEGSSKIAVEIDKMTVGSSNALGIYGRNIHIDVKGDINVAAGESVGIISSGKGDISYEGNLSIDDREGKEGSIGIYKVLGEGKITNTVGNWVIGNGGYGIYVQQEEKGKITENKVIVENKADIELGNSSIGIFSNGKNTINNSGKIIIESSDNGNYENTVGMYLAGGSKGENLLSGNIIVKCDRAIGVLVNGKDTSFENNGKIEIDNGGVGIVVQNGGIATNNGEIILGGIKSNDGNTTIGMAAYSGGTIINKESGIITVNEGIGMYVSADSYLKNYGKINVVNGTGIVGTGNVINSGEINISGQGTTLELSASADIGAITISPEGNITINDKYVSIGGTLTVDGTVNVDGAYVDVTTNMPVFNATSVNGEINILPNFAGTGNGISYEIENFVTTALGGSPGDKIVPATSPLFVAKIVNDDNLVIVKRPYADITIGEQFDALDKGLDNILSNSNGIGKDAEILKGLNVYLEGLRGAEFEREASRTLAETRGDIYSTIQGRMQDINKAFNNSFSELESSYNLTKNSNKLGVINVEGDYKDSTIGIDDYDYNIKGFVFMKEKEGKKLGNKYGYTLGFAGSKFDFDDGGSKEDVYSLRVGAHIVNVLNENQKINLLSRIELGYNRHHAERKIELNKVYENEADYNTYTLSLNNKLSKNIYKDKTGELELYTDLGIEYAKVDGFTEETGKKGGLEVKVKENNYLSTQLGVGVKGSRRLYLNNNVALKATGEIKYTHEFGDNYDGNKAKLKSGNENYYKLVTPEKYKEKLSGKIGLTLEKIDSMGVTFEVEIIDDRHKEDTSTRYGMRFSYKF